MTERPGQKNLDAMTAKIELARADADRIRRDVAAGAAIARTKTLTAAQKEALWYTSPREDLDDYVHPGWRALGEFIHPGWASGYRRLIDGLARQMRWLADRPIIPTMILQAFLIGGLAFFDFDGRMVALAAGGSTVAFLLLRVLGRPE